MFCMPYLFLLLKVFIVARGLGGGGLQEKVGNVEKTIHFQRSASHLNKEYIVSLLIYYVSIFHMPRVVRLRLDHIQRNFLFLWGGGN